MYAQNKACEKNMFLEKWKEHKDHIKFFLSIWI